MRKTNLHLYSLQYSVYKKRDKFTFDIVSGILEFKKGCELSDMLPSYRTMKYKSLIWGYFHVQKKQNRSNSKGKNS